MSELRKELGIDDWLELVKEDKNLSSAYTSFAQYMYFLEQENQQLKEQLEFERQCQNRFFKVNNKTYDGKIVLAQLKQRDKVIDKAINHINSIYGWRKAHMDTSAINVPLMTLCEELLEILQRYKGDN